MKLKWFLIILGGVLVLVVTAGLYFWNAMQQPLYQPGMLSQGKGLESPLSPPPQVAGEGTWLVEKDIRLHYFADGQGMPVLVIHGGPGFPFSAPPAGFHQLADQYRFYYYDQRGCGGSTRPFDRFSSSNMYQNMQSLNARLGVEAQLADIERIRQILGQDQIILVGHSFGGFLATLYAAEFPEHVKALVLVAPAEMLVMPARDGGLFEEIKAYLPESMLSDYDSYLKRYLDFGNLFKYSDAELAALNNEFGRYYSAAAQAKGFFISPGQPESAGGWMVWGLYASLGQRHDYRAALGKIGAPVLVLHGSLDLQPEQASQEYASLVQHGQFQAIAGAGHFIFDDQPEAFAQAVTSFLRSIK